MSPDNGPSLSPAAPLAGHRFDAIPTYPKRTSGSLVPPVTGRAPATIQRQKENEEKTPFASSHKSDVAPEKKENEKKKEPDDAPPPPAVFTDASGSTTLKELPPPVHDVYRGATLKDVIAALPEEAGSVTFEIAESTEGDPVSRTTVEIKQEMHLPKWEERDRQCPEVQAAWDAFYDALKQHEDDHVAINRQHFDKAHRQYNGKSSAEVQSLTTELEKAAKAASDEYDEKTDHGRRGKPPVLIDPNVGCADSSEDLQTKLDVSQPGDPFEFEADRVADQVMRMPDPRGVRMGLGPGSDLLEHVSGSALAVTAAQFGGQPLDAETRAFMEPRFGFDFSRVRIHADSEAGEAARSINARAYTLGSDVVFAPGRYSPVSSEGRRLLAHELTHVIQQTAERSDTAPRPSGILQRDAATVPATRLRVLRQARTSRLTRRRNT